MKTCYHCHKTKPFSDFFKEKLKKDGHTSRCRDCTNKMLRERRVYGYNVMNRYKLRKGCSKCGYKEHHAALEFNHINPVLKRFCISSLVRSVSFKKHTKTKIKFKEELGNCEVLCANCHNIHTYGQEYSKKNYYKEEAYVTR